MVSPMKKFICLVVFAGCLVGCAGAPVKLSPSGNRVRVAPQNAVESCSFVSVVTAEVGGNFQSYADNAKIATNQLRNEAGSLGATHMVIIGVDRQDSSAGGWGNNCRNCVLATGQAFSCN